MSTLIVDQLSNKSNDGAITFTKGLVVSSGYALTCAGGVNVGGALTATSLSGDGNAITGLPGMSPKLAIAFKRILTFTEFRT